MPPRAERIRAALTAAFAPSTLIVVDDSARHAGHGGTRPEGETHFSVTMSAAAFRAMSRVERSRQVHAALAVEFASGLHALSVNLRTPEEHAAATEAAPRT
jgi:BolA protein